MTQSPDIGQNSDGGIFDFRISGQSLINENYSNSKANNDIDIKLGSLTKLDKRNTAASKKFDDDIMSTKCDVFVIFQFCAQFGAIRKPGCGNMVHESYIFINSNLVSYKN